MKIKSIKNAHFKILQEFNLDFTSQGHTNPITVLAGINGSGKTSILELIFNEVNDKINDKLPNSLDVENIEKGHLFYYKAGEENISAKKTIADYIDELIYEKDTKSSLAYIEMRKIINEIFSEIDLQIEFSKLDKEREVYFKNALSDEIKIEELSGGEKEILTKVLPLFLHNIKDSVILIDEPESSLHPNWQNQIVGLYKRIAERVNNQFIIATHSPHIVSAVEKQYIKILSKENGRIKVIDNSSPTYGKRVDEILLEIFKVKGLRTPPIEAKLTELKGMLNIDQVESTQFTSLLTELENTIGKFDNDLSLIRLEALKLKKGK